MTLPNIISIGRILLIPIFAQVFIGAKTREDFMLAGTIVAFSGLTDILDGYIARRYNMQSKLGKVLDPAADKLTVFAVVGCLWLRYPDLSVLFAVFIAKEIIMAVAALFILHKNKDIVASRWFGKLYTVVFYLCTIGAVLDFRESDSLRTGLMIFMVFFTLLSFVLYIPVFFGQVYHRDNANDKIKVL